MTARWALLALILVGAGLRLYFALEEREPKRDETHRYLAIAQSLRDGAGFSLRGHPTAQAMPLWPVVAAWAPSPRVLAAALSTLAIGLAWLLARCCLTVRGALFVAGLMALDLEQARLGGTALTEPLFTVLLLGCANAWMRARTMLASVLLAAAALTRPEVVLLPFLLALCGRTWRRPAITLAVLVLALAPWAWRNTARLGAFVPLTTMGGITLHSAWNDVEPTLPFRKRGQGRGIKFEAAAELARLGEVQPDRAHRKRAFDALRQHPTSLALTAVRKATLLATPWQRKGTSITFALATILAWFALATRRIPTATWRAAAPFLILLFVVGLTFLAIPRYRAPYHAFVYLLAAAGACQTNQRTKKIPTTPQ